ncbi:hypothetical protein EX30DRAFT_341361 [Ascodesmis nigricans]|uniref:Ecp2 effector protein domain-containing protein n=1 Tax=Ascodesmis nigricans TaxID=341454 RepID=A0A4S2MVZ9_9PEZI|nr:hypothetical protein EX30DRAFT_341361 [Ascodesmis nigricans]
MRSTSWATLFLPFFALATAAPADQALATPVVITKYFGPARTQPTELPEAEASATSDGVSIASAGVTCHRSGIWSHNLEIVIGLDYCTDYHGVVIPNGYELYVSYGLPNYKIDVGYRNIAGGNWVINHSECNNWMWEIIRACGGSSTRGGYISVSSGRVDLDPNAY